MKDYEGYYVDINYNLYKKCYHTCKTCSREGNELIHDCNKCNDNFLFIIKINNPYNCFKNCSYYYYDNEKIFHCTMNLSCPYEYPKLDEKSKECIKSDINDNNSIDSIINLLNFKMNENTIKTIN